MWHWGWVSILLGGWTVVGVEWKANHTFGHLFVHNGGFLSHGGSPKSSIYTWMFHYKPSVWGTSIYGNSHICTTYSRRLACVSASPIWSLQKLRGLRQVNGLCSLFISHCVQWFSFLQQRRFWNRNLSCRYSWSPETCLEHIHVKRSSIPRLDSQSVTNKTWQMYQFHRVPILFMMIQKLDWYLMQIA